MDIIHLLPDSVANQIAAGEVIQRPASVVKELVENSIDAGASKINIIIKDAGRTLIQVIDNGKGMSGTDARLCFERHATSKIKNAADLFSLRTMGFRGEALASIAAIAHVELKTRREEDEIGTVLRLAASKVESQEATNTPVGANFAVRDIFFNVPARRKFLKSNNVEFSNIATEFERVAIANPNIGFSLSHNGTEIYNLLPSSQLQRIIAIFGKSMNQQLLPVSVDTVVVKVSGFVCKPEAARKRGALQYFFVNGRYMKHPYFNKAVTSCYDNLIPVGEMPNYFINLSVNPEEIDVNIHPTKTEIKFENEQTIWPILSAAVKESLGKFNAVPSIDFDTEDAPEIPIFKAGSPAPAKPQISYDPTYNPFKMKYNAVNDDWQNLYENFEKKGSASDMVVMPEMDVETDAGQEPTGPLFPAAAGVSAGNYIQVKDRYIVTSIKSGMVVVDQHRAHTRILFDKYIEQLNGRGGMIQRILFPQVITFSQSQAEILAGIEGSLSDMGFEISNMGGGSYSVTGVPDGVKVDNYEELLMAIIESASECGKADAGIIQEKIALTLAAKTAIPYGQKLSDAEMEQITESLFASPEANFTPDGRPTLITVTTEELLKRFK